MPSQFNDLPHEVLHLILEYIDPKQYVILRSVNTVWNSLLSPHVFNSVTIFNYFRRKRSVDSILDDMERSLAKLTTDKHAFGIPIGHYIQQLALLNDDITGDQLRRIPDLCPNITSFAISSKIMDNIIPQELSVEHRYGFHYAHLIENCADRTVLADLDTCRALLVGFFTSLGGPKVSKLRLEGTTSYPMLNEIILPSLSLLVELDIGSVVWQPDYDFVEQPFLEPFVDMIELMDLIQDNCPCLESLSMVKRGFSAKEQGVGVATLEGLANWVSTIRVWPRLASLCLNINITQRCSRYWLVPTLMYLATRLPGLQHLRMSERTGTFAWDYSDLVKDELLVYLLRAGLEDLSSSKEKRVWPYIFCRLQSIMLDGIHVGFLEKMLLLGYDEFVQGSAIMTSIQSMELHNSIMTFEHGNGLALDPEVNFLRYYMSQNPMKSLKLCHCGLSDKHLLDALTFGTNQLEILDITDFNSIDMNSLLDLCPHLQHLRLTACGIYGSTVGTSTTIQASTLTAEDHHHPLKILDLTRINIKDSYVFGLISQRCRQLSVLHLEDISIYDSSETKKGGTQQPCGGTKHYKNSAQLGALIYMPHTKLSLCTFGGNAHSYGHRRNKTISNILLLPFTSTKADHRLGSLWCSTGKEFLAYDVVLPKKYSQKVLDKMVSLGESFGGGGGDGSFGTDDEAFLHRMKRDGLLTIQCKDILELVISGHTYYTPFGDL